MSAVLSSCGTWRYRLRREWLTGVGEVCWIMLNPSTADAEVDDPTIRKVVGFSQRWGFRSATVVNLYAYRATDPKVLRSAEREGVDVVGPGNDRHIVDAVYDAQRVIVGWGRNEPASGARVRRVTGLLCEHTAWCLGTVGNGQPRHPLMPAYATELEPWVAA